MDQGSCSGGTSFTKLVSHQDRDRGAELDRWGGQRFPTQGFRTQSEVDSSRESHEAFLSQNNGLPALVPGAAIPGLSSVRSPVNLPHGAFPATVNHHLPQQYQPASHIPQAQSSRVLEGKEWSMEFANHSLPLQGTTLHTANAAQPLHSPFALSQPQAAFHHPIIQPGTMYNNTMASASTYHRPIQNHLQAGPEPQAQFTHWLDTHRPPLVAFDDIDEALKEISKELDQSSFWAESSKEAQPVVQHVTEPSSLNSSAPTTLGQRDANLGGHSTTSEQSNGAGDQTGISDVARKILEAVDHESGDKWKDSAFLALMRDFRDGKKDVREDSIADLA